MNFDVFRSLSYGVYITTTMNGERPVGCVTNSIMQVTSNPAAIAVSINHDNFTNECIRKTGKFAFSVLSENSNVRLIGTFGFRSGRDFDKFAGIDYKMVEEVPVIPDSCGYVVCRVTDTMETTTHTVFLGEVIAAETSKPDDPPMTYAYYHNVVKGKSPKTAPTYLPDKPKE